MSDQFSLENRASPAPSGVQGGIPYASSGTAIGWVAPATGTQILTQTNNNPPVWSDSSGGSGTLVTLKETVFAGQPLQSFTNGNTYTIDGSAYLCGIAGNGSADMVATGLRLRQGTTSGASFQSMKIVNGTTGDFNSIIGQQRLQRGVYAFWSRMASWDYTTASNQVYGSSLLLNAVGKYGIGLRNRVKNVLGAPNTATGGIAVDWWYATNPAPASYPGIATPDVLMAFVRTPSIVDFYYGTYSGGWPAMENMTVLGRAQMQSTTFAAGFGVNLIQPSSVDMDIWFQFGGSAASSGTYEIIYDRWRLTTWV